MRRTRRQGEKKQGDEEDLGDEQLGYRANDTPHTANKKVEGYMKSYLPGCVPK